MGASVVGAVLSFGGASVRPGDGFRLQLLTINEPINRPSNSVLGRIIIEVYVLGLGMSWVYTVFEAGSS